MTQVKAWEGDARHRRKDDERDNEASVVPPVVPAAGTAPPTDGKTPPGRGFLDAGGGTRTPDTRIMIAAGWSA